MSAAQSSRDNFSAKHHHEAAVAAMRDGDMQNTRQHLDRGIPLAQTDFANNPSRETAQRASEMLLQEGRYWDRMARSAQTEEEQRRFRQDALGSAQAATDIARNSGENSLAVLPLVFTGDLQVRQADMRGAIAAYREALTYPLAEGHTPAYTFVIEGKLHRAEYEAKEKTVDGADPLLAAEAALELLENYTGESNPDTTTKQIWVSGGHLDIAEAIARNHDGENRDKAYTHYQAAVEIIRADEEKLSLRQADAAKVREVLEGDLDHEFAEAQALRNTGDENKQQDALAAYDQVERHAQILHDPIMEGHAIHMRGVTKYAQKEYASADEEYQKAQKVFEKADDTLLQGAVLRDRSSIAIKQEAYERAHTLIGQSIELLRAAGNNEHLGMSLIKEAQIFAAEHNTESAEARIREGIQTVDQDGDTYFRGHTRINAAEILQHTGNLDEAERLIEDAEDILTRVETNQDTDIIFQADRNKIAQIREQIADKKKA